MSRFLSDSGKCGYNRYLDDHRAKYGEEPQHMVLLDWEYIAPGKFDSVTGITRADVKRERIQSTKLTSCADGAYAIEMNDGTIFEVWSKGFQWKVIKISAENRAQYDAWCKPMPYMLWAN